MGPSAFLGIVYRLRRCRLRFPEQVGRLYAKHLGEAVHDVDPSCIDASFERTDICAIDTGTMRQLFLRQALRETVRPQIVCQYLSYLHIGEDKAL